MLWLVQFRSSSQKFRSVYLICYKKQTFLRIQTNHSTWWSVFRKINCMSRDLNKRVRVTHSGEINVRHYLLIKLLLVFIYQYNQRQKAGKLLACSILKDTVIRTEPNTTHQLPARLLIIVLILKPAKPFERYVDQ